MNDVFSVIFRGEKSQKKYHSLHIFSEIPGVISNIDDVLISKRNLQEHD